MIAFVAAAAICFLFLMSGLELVQAFFQAWAPAFLVDAVARLSPSPASMRSRKACSICAT